MVYNQGEVSFPTECQVQIQLWYLVGRNFIPRRSSQKSSLITQNVNTNLKGVKNNLDIEIKWRK